MNRRQLCLGTAALALSGSALPQTAATGDPAMPSALQNAINAAIKGSYPADILELVQKYQPDTGIKEGDAAKVGAAKPEFLGINYYAPLYIRTRKDAKTDYAPEMQLSDGDKEVAFNGAVRPDLFEELLLRIRDEWDNPTVIITENDTTRGIAAENAWIAQNHPGYRKIGQALIKEGGGIYDRIDLQAPDGSRHSIYFEISSFFGKINGKLMM